VIRQAARRARAAPAGLAVVILVAGCGWDGPTSGVAVVPPASLAPTGGPVGEAALEAEQPPASSEPQVVEVAESLVTVPPIPEATLPRRGPAASDLPDTVAVVGDSLTMSAHDEISGYLTALGIEVLAIDGAENRRMTHGDRPRPGIDVIEQIASVAEPELWVIALGTNDVGAESTADAFGTDVETLIEAIPDGAPVVWVNLYIRDRPAQIEAANRVIAETLGDGDDSIVADWFQHGDEPGLVTADGVHLTEDGQFVFAATIAAATVALFD
jgi:lysophospholipase L1-like esterase